MPRGNAQQCKVHYPGKEDDFIVYVDSAEALNNWKKDRSIPLAQVVNGFSIFVTHKHGAQGIHNEASHATLENEFGTHNDDECMVKILEGGNLQEVEAMQRHGPKNDSKGQRLAH